MHILIIGVPLYSAGTDPSDTDNFGDRKAG